MRHSHCFALAACAFSLLLAAHARAAVQKMGNAYLITGPGYAATFSASNGSLLSFARQRAGKAIVKSGEQGLWRVRMQGGATVDAASFGAPGAAFACEPDAKANALRMTYRSADLVVRANVTGRADGLEFAGQLTPASGTVLDFALPARLRFDAADVRRFICPTNGNTSVGMAFNRAFFAAQPQDRPAAWQQERAGAEGYAALYGGGLDQRADVEPAVKLTVTPEGARWLGEAAASRLQGSEAMVNRPPTRAQAELTLVDSPNGPFFSGNHLGGTGWIWRVGGAVGDAERERVAEMVEMTVRALLQAPGARAKVGVAALANGPASGGWAGVPVSEWLARFGRIPGAQVVALESPTQVLDAARGNDFAVILNPYGEWAPAPAEAGMPATINAVRSYVRGGGSWFEVGGYPFFYALKPVRHFAYSAPYPPAFADFLHLDSANGAASLYRVQPLAKTPWIGAKDHAAIFVPGNLGCGSDERGGYCERAYGAYVAPGTTWSAPPIRLVTGRTAEQSLQDYCRANGITRKLADKMKPDVLAKFKQSVMVYYGGSAREKLEYLDRLPKPALIHFADYLHGGFDKQYPDHLPPNPGFGTPAEMRELFDKAHARGDLVMPYTNPTWWCDHPRGPTFEREGDAPLLRTLDGKLAYEKYGANDGYTVTHWHPAVQAANRKTVRQFSDEYPVDVLFQDQNGARGWTYDTNPASPTPYAYMDGLLSQVAEDSREKPLSTENGWDRVANYEAQLCGMTWGIVPTQGGPEWRQFLKQQYPPDLWTIYPLAQYVAHDKTAMIHHDLGQFVTNRETLTWTLGLGYAMSGRIGAAELAQDRPREWLRWLDRVQKSICARYVGEPVRAFAHERGPKPTVEDDGLLRATYGPVTLAANLGPAARAVNGQELAPHGFVASAPGMVAANLAKLGGLDFGEEGVSFVAEGNGQAADVWVYAPGGQEVAVELPARVSRAVTLAFDDGTRAGAKAAGGVVRFPLPSKSARRVAPPAALAGKAPRDWSGAKPAVGVLDFAGAPGGLWTRITPSDWRKALGASRLATQMGVQVKPITSVEELQAALKAGPTSWLAIVNPYGEAFPEAGPGRWREMLDAVRDYVQRGGSWWETAGYTFTGAIYPANGGWQSESAGPSGAGYMALPIGPGAVDAPADALSVTPQGQQVLGPELAARIATLASATNRGLDRGANDPGHVTLVRGPSEDFIGGYRLGGWGWLWRIGGFWPNPEVALPTVAATLEYLYTHAPMPVAAGGTRYLWHAKVR